MNFSSDTIRSYYTSNSKHPNLYILWTTDYRPDGKDTVFDRLANKIHVRELEQEIEIKINAGGGDDDSDSGAA